MTTTNLLLIAALLLGIACFVYIVFAAKRLSRTREERVNGKAPAAPTVAAPTVAAPPPATPAAAPPITERPPAEPAPLPADLSSPFLAAPVGTADDLMRIKGIGPKLSARLAELGVFHYSQIADWTPAQLDAVDTQLGNFQGRPMRDQWQSQARLLASGDVKAYERAHGKLEPPAGGPAA
jgi:predicted flap endonuclease-1-like 5' DNA nuclease